MHNYIKNKKVEKHQLGGFLSSFLAKGGADSLMKGFGSKFPKGGVGNIPTGIKGGEQEQMGGENMANILGQGLNAALTGMTAFSDINNSGMNRTQKSMGKADAAVDMISGAASMIPGIGGVIGGALGGLNKLGGALIGTPKIVKNYVTNDAVTSSSAYGGVNRLAEDAANSAESYKGAGLTGKLFGRNKVKRQVTDANLAQLNASRIINEGQFVKNRAASSASLFANNNMAKLYDSDRFTTNNIAVGQEGMKINFRTKGLLRNNKTNPNVQERSAEFAKGKTEVDAFDEVLSAPQKSAVWMLGGGYKTPSEALPFKNKYVNAGIDMIADPLNVAFFLKGTKASKALQAISEPKLTPFRSTLINMTHPRDIKKAGTLLRNLKITSNTQDAQSLYNNLVMNKEGGKIHIKKANVGKFTEYKKRTGKTTEEALHSEDPHVRKMAQFAKNAKSWKHKEGGVIDFKKILRSVKTPEPIVVIEEVTEEIIETFKDGGQINVIVNGKLHAHKHNLKDLEEFKDAEITEKGVAVITKAEGGEIKQQAEVEKDELILHLKLSKQLENWTKEGTPEHMIKAGKLLAKEILDNTKDSASGILEDD